MSTDWRYGAAIKHKMAIRTEANPNAKNYFYNFNHTNHWYYGNDLNYHLKLFWMSHKTWLISIKLDWIRIVLSDWDLNLATHIEERLYVFGAPFVMFHDFTDGKVSWKLLTHKFCQKQTVNMSETKQKWTRPVKINDATMGKVYQKSGGRLGTTSETWILRHKWISRKRWRSSCTQVRLMTFMRYLTITTDLGLQADI